MASRCSGLPRGSSGSGLVVATRHDSVPPIRPCLPASPLAACSVATFVSCSDTRISSINVECSMSPQLSVRFAATESPTFATTTHPLSFMDGILSSCWITASGRCCISWLGDADRSPETHLQEKWGVCSSHSRGARLSPAHMSRTLPARAQRPSKGTWLRPPSLGS